MNQTPPGISLGVVGAGTMGAGIAQVAVAAGFAVVLCDAVPDALDRAVERIRAGLRRERLRGLSSAHEMAHHSNLTTATELDAMAGCDLVVEAVPEELELKQQLFRRLAAVCRADAVLASNTSSIPLTSIAAGATDPAQVVGLHFFNPVARMRLVEVIPAQQTAPETIQRATAIAEGLGKRVILAPDGPGFLVNRCGRALYGESLRILAERIAGPAQIDRICRIGGGFRMGPFELMDLVGNDVSLAVARSFASLSFGEPRWRPSVLQSRLVAAGRLGRKTGRGWYEYGSDSHRPDDPSNPEPGGGDGRELVVVGNDRPAGRLRQQAGQAGFLVRAHVRASALATVFTDPDTRAADIGEAPCPIVSCATQSLAARRLPGAVGFNLPNLAGRGRLVELTSTDLTPPTSVIAADDLFTRLGTHKEWVADAPGLVLGRILAQVVNEAAFAHGEGLGSARDIDTGVALGLNYPFGSLTWGSKLGWTDVLQTLDGIWQERREERYRPAPALITNAARECADRIPGANG